MRDDQTDICPKSGSCGAGCPVCAAKTQINFRPIDIRAQFLSGGVDPKLTGAGAPSDNA